MNNYSISENELNSFTKGEKDSILKNSNSKFFSLPKYLIDDHNLFSDIFYSFTVIVLYRIALECNPFRITSEELAKIVKCSQSKILEVMDKLNKDGYIFSFEKFNMENGSRNIYITLNFLKLEQISSSNIDEESNDDKSTDEILDPLYLESKEGLEFLKKIQNLGFTFTPSETRKILHLIKESKAAPLSAYNRSTYLRGESDIKPSKGMFLKLSTWEKIAAYAYDDLDKKNDKNSEEKKNLTLSELRELERSKKSFGNLSEYLKNQKK